MNEIKCRSSPTTLLQNNNLEALFSLFLRFVVVFFFSRFALLSLSRAHSPRAFFVVNKK
jgi:hypothetical protein